MTADAALVPGATGTIDYVVNCFLPNRQEVWDGAIASSGIAVKVRRDPTDAFCDADEMVARMDELGVATLCLSTCDIADHGTLSRYDFEHVATRWEEMEKLVGRFPGRFVALMAPNPGKGMAAVFDARARLAEPWVAGFYLHTHSWDRPFDHPDFYPYYALCSEFDVPFTMQAGTSGGLMPSACGQPVGIDRPALFFPQTNFMLSHLGWPWVDEAIAMALKFPNVYLGTGAYPPRHYSDAVRSFIRGPGKRKTIFGTNFPTVGHRHALAQIDELELRDDVRYNLLEGNARSIFHRLPGAAASGGAHR